VAAEHQPIEPGQRAGDERGVTVYEEIHGVLLGAIVVFATTVVSEERRRFIVVDSSTAQARQTMKIDRFEDIEAWRSARKLMNIVYDATQSSAFEDDRDLKRQLRKAATSSMANIAEGFDAGTDNEFQRFLRMAQRSATEVQSHLYVALDRQYFDRGAFDTIYGQAQETRRVIGGFIKYLQRSTSPTAGRSDSGDQGPRTKDQGQRGPTT
jgi:four helix bundle protein